MVASRCRCEGSGSGQAGALRTLPFVLIAVGYRIPAVTAATTHLRRLLVVDGLEVRPAQRAVHPRRTVLRHGQLLERRDGLRTAVRRQVPYRLQQGGQQLQDGGAAFGAAGGAAPGGAAGARGCSWKRGVDLGVR